MDTEEGWSNLVTFILACMYMYVSWLVKKNPNLYPN